MEFLIVFSSTTVKDRLLQVGLAIFSIDIRICQPMQLREERRNIIGILIIHEGSLLHML